MNVLGVTTAYDPGCHCAFTDVFKWRGRVYLVFREALNHSIQPSGQIVVLASADGGRSFQPHGRIALGGHDLRDPHLFSVGERLFITIPAWKLPRERCSFVASSDDGMRWELHAVEGLKGRTIWRPRAGPDGAHYAAVYSHEEPYGHAVRLMRTEDGLNWDEISLISDDGKPNETELYFLDGGELLALVRREEPPNHPHVARAEPPYEKWSHVECDRSLWGPMLERLPDGRFLVVGRSPMRAEERKGARVTRAFLLDPGTGKLSELFTLPSGGDTSYAGLAWLDEREALLSYYSGHLYSNGSYRGGDEPQRTGIYIARLVP